MALDPHLGNVKETPLILLPGLGASAAIFAPQREVFSNLVVPDWPTPNPCESLSAYAKRLATRLDPGIPCIVGGISFGGILATELGKHMDARQCILISSVKHPDYLPVRVRILLPLARHVPALLIQLGEVLLRTFRPVARLFLSEASFHLYCQACHARSEIAAWSLWALATWQPSPEQLRCPIAQVHGTRDRVFPVRCAPGAYLVRGGKHVLTISNPAEVNGFLAEVGDRMASDKPPHRIES